MNSLRVVGRIRTASGCSSRGTDVRPRGASSVWKSCSTSKVWQPRRLPNSPSIYSAPVPESAELERRTTELLQRLIRFNTVNPPGNEQAAQEFLRELLEGVGFECELLSAVEGRPNLIARLRGPSDGPSLCFLGHVDTVLANPAEWSVDPWS